MNEKNPASPHGGMLKDGVTDWTPRGGYSRCKVVGGWAQIYFFLSYIPRFRFCGAGNMFLVSCLPVWQNAIGFICFNIPMIVYVQWYMLRHHINNLNYKLL